MLRVTRPIVRWVPKLCAGFRARSYRQRDMSFAAVCLLVNGSQLVTAPVSVNAAHRTSRA